MKLSTLIKRLQSVQKAQGDIRVVIDIDPYREGDDEFAYQCPLYQTIEDMPFTNKHGDFESYRQFKTLVLMSIPKETK